MTELKNTQMDVNKTKPPPVLVERDRQTTVL